MIDWSSWLLIALVNIIILLDVLKHWVKHNQINFIPMAQNLKYKIKEFEWF